MSTPSSAQPYDAHLECPHPTDPDLELLPLQTLDVLQLDPFPPATARRLSPKQKELLRHAHRAATHLITADIGAQPGECQAANDGLVRFPGTMTPPVVVIEAAAFKLVSHTNIEPPEQKKKHTQL